MKINWLSAFGMLFTAGLAGAAIGAAFEPLPFVVLLSLIAGFVVGFVWNEVFPVVEDY